MHPPLGPWVCEHCLTAPERYIERVKERIRRDDERRREQAKVDAERREQIAQYYGTKNWIKFVKVVFVYRDGGSIDKHELHICERTDKYPSNQVAAVFLRYGREGRIMAECRPTSDSD